MADLPINISSAPVKAAAIKSTANDDAAQQDTQGFGDVLSRQVADSSRPATSNQTPSGDAGKQANEKESTEPTAISDAATSLPADILAAMLAQQGQLVMTAPEIKGQADANTQSESDIQTALNLQTPAGTPGQPGKAAGAALALTGVNAMATTATPASDIALSKLEVSAKDGKGFAEALKASGMKETGLSANSKTLGANTISDLSSAPQQQPIIIPLAAGAAAPAGPLTINTPVNQPAWGDEFGQKITWMANQRNQSAELHLNPPQLGPLDVVLKMNGDQATAMFTSPHAAVRDAIEQAIPKLREMLADNGIMLGHTMVSDHTANNRQDNAPRKPQGRETTAEGINEGGKLQEARVTGISRHNGMVDTFA